MATIQTSDEITRLYAATFNRTPDTVGLAYWNNTADAGWSIPQIAQWFSASPEFVQDYGALSDPEFVTQLYANVLGRSPDAAGAAYWTNDLARGDTRGNILNGFAQSQENIAHTAVVAAPAVAQFTPSVVPSQAVPALAAPAPAVVASVETAPVTPAPAAAPVALPDPVITGVQTVNTPGAFVLTTASRSDTSTLITTHDNAAASNFTFASYGGQLELSDLQFDGYQFASNATVPPGVSGLGAESIRWNAGGIVTLTENGSPVGSLNVLSSNAFNSTFTGVDQTTGYSFIHSG
jgi:hypothetical protein